MAYTKPNIPIYRLAQLLSSVVSIGTYKRKFKRNELRGVKGPAVVIANHQSALDFVNLIGATRTPMNFVISNTFYNTLPLRYFMRKIGCIPKQQFQTTLSDIKAMKSVVEHGGILVLYPAGLMCEDGLSTPIPEATYHFIQMLHADVYVAKCIGNYLCSPKWADKKRPGRTYMDVYKLIDAEKLRDMPPEEFEKMASEALDFDAYREQDELKIKYKKPNIKGLENVLYICPHCKAEFKMQVENGNRLVCSACGYAHESDEYSMLHNVCGFGEEIRYVSDFAKKIYKIEEDNLRLEEGFSLSSKAKVRTIDYKKKKFVDVGEATLTITEHEAVIDGVVEGTETRIAVPSYIYPSLPFKPGKYIEIQLHEKEYRLVLEDGRLAMKFINLIKILHTKREMLAPSHRT